MLDLLIIALYVFVAIKILLSFFSWLQSRFYIFGKTTYPREETSVDQSSLGNQNTLSNSKVDQKFLKPGGGKLLTKESQQKASITSKKDPVQSFIKIQGPSLNQSKKESDFVICGQKNREISNPSNLSEPQQNNKMLNQSILPAELKQNISQFREQHASQSQKQKNQKNLQGKEVVLMKEFQVMRRQKENAIEKMLRYVQNTNKQKQILISNHEKEIQAIMNEKKNLQNSIKQLKQIHNQSIKQLEIRHSQTISQLETKLNQMQIVSEQSQRTHQEEIQYSRANKQKPFIIDHQIESTINETANRSINAETPSTIVDPFTQAKIQELKSQLQFCQSQLQQAYQSQAKLKEEVQELKNESALRTKTKSQISISDVINHPEYLRIKEKLQKYENGTASSYIRSPMRSQITPRGDRLSKGGVQSRISQRRSFITTSKTNTDGGDYKPENVQEVFAECNFLDIENKGFLLDEIKRIKKLPIKKTKLLFKLDKLSPANPHEFIDNIPNIVLLIELTNKKVLGAFTQTAFSREDGNHNQSTSSVARSRLGTNKSLILDLTNKVAFMNNNPNETIIYDENAIVWGKDELIIKNDEPTLLYSSFGLHEGVYSDEKYTVDDLLGGNQGFERISQYEFYRIYIG